MKNVNCPVCIWEFLHYSSASLVPAAPSPWQLPAPCSQCTHTHMNKSIKMHPHTQRRYPHLHYFFQIVLSQLFRWLTPSLTSEAPVCYSVCVSLRECVCVSIWFIDIRETYNAHACPLSVCVSCWWQKIRTFLKLHAHRFWVLFLWGPSPTWFLPCSLAFVPTLPTNNINSITWSWNTGLF